MTVALHGYERRCLSRKVSNVVIEFDAKIGYISAIYYKEGNYMNISNITELITGIALFLFGMLLMGEGLKQVAGNKLEIILYKLTGSPLKGLLFGTGITTVIQSSSATSVMVVGFVNSGIMKLK